MLEPPNRGMNGTEKIRVRPLPDQLVMMIGNRYFDVILISLVGKNDVGLRLTPPVIEYFPYLFEFGCQFLRLRRREIHVAPCVSDLHLVANP
jgi:hypothetical protein